MGFFVVRADFVGSIVGAYARYVGLVSGGSVVVIVVFVGVLIARVGFFVSTVGFGVDVGAFDGVGVRDNKARKLAVGATVVVVVVLVGVVGGTEVTVTFGFPVFEGRAVVASIAFSFSFVVGTF